MMTSRLPSGQSRRTPLFRRLGVTWACAAVLLLGVSSTGAPSSNAADDGIRRPGSATATGNSTAPQANLRVREGTELVDEIGHFRRSGGRILFFSADGKRRLVGLENLNLERVARTIAQSPQTLQWGVTGTITEYRGANFLLVRRAILRSGMPSPGGSF